MGNPWFRMYGEILDDAKVQMMPFDMQRHLLMLFALRSQQPTEKMAEDQIAFRLRVDETFLKQIKETFLKRGFIEKDWSICNWNKRQYLSDSSTPRVREHRKKRALKQDETFLKQDVTVSVTPPDTEQIQNRTEKPLARASKKVLFVVPDWLDRNAWDDYTAMRQRIRKPMTERAKCLALMQLEQFRARGMNTAKVLEQSTFNSWQGLFELKNGNGGRNNGGYYENLARELGVDLDEEIDQAGDGKGRKS